MCFRPEKPVWSLHCKRFIAQQRIQLTLSCDMHVILPLRSARYNIAHLHNVRIIACMLPSRSPGYWLDLTSESTNHRLTVIDPCPARLGLGPTVRPVDATRNVNAITSAATRYGTPDFMRLQLTRQQSESVLRPNRDQFHTFFRSSK